MNIYVTDLDGTFIHHSTMVDKNLECFKKLYDKGNMLIFASGRHINLIIDQFPKLKEIGSYFISENGAEIYKNNDGVITRIFHEEFSYEEAMTIYDIFKDSTKVGLLTKEEVGHLYLDKVIPDEFIKLLSPMFKISYLDYPSFVKDNAKSKILLFGLREDLEEQKKLIPDFADYFYTGPYSLEMMQKGVNKGSAITRIISEDHLVYDKLFAFGDNGNDIPMLKLADVSVAMKESTIDVKEAAKYVTTIPCEDGAVAKFIEDYKD